MTKIHQWISNISIIVLTVIYAGSILVYGLGSYNTDFFQGEKIHWVEYGSILIFIISLCLGFKNIKWYAVVLVFNILALPASVDNILPSVLISSSQDITKVYFPMFSHIDIFIIFGIIKYWISSKIETKNNQVSLGFIKLILAGLILIFLSIVFNIFRNFTLYDVGLILANTFHLRYFLLLLILSVHTNVLDYSKEFFLGLSISIIFLLAEAVLYSQVFHNFIRLISGTLRNNTFANILAALSCYYTFLILRKKISRSFFFLVMAMVTAIWFTNTRSALFIVITYFVIEFFVFLILLVKERKKTLTMYKLGITVLIVFAVVFGLQKNNRLAIQNLKVKEINLSKNTLTEIIVLENNDFTGSLVLRLNHFQTSLNMIKEYPIFGIGPGRWNVYKGDYGSKDKNIMDSHNDILAFCSQYGLLPGIVFCCSLYFIPYFTYREKRKKGFIEDIPISYLFIVTFIMFLAGVTNAGLFKHQVFGFVVFILIVGFNNSVKKNNKG